MICIACENKTFNFNICHDCRYDELVCIYSPNIYYHYRLKDDELANNNLTFIKVPNEITGWGYYLVSELEALCDKLYKDLDNKNSRKKRYLEQKIKREQLRIDRTELVKKKESMLQNVKDILTKYDFEQYDDYDGTVNKMINDYCKWNPSIDFHDSVMDVVNQVIGHYGNKLNDFT